MEQECKHWYHVCGSQSVSETVSSVKLDLYPHLESYHPSRTQVIPTLMNLLVDNLGIDSNSQIVVACDYYFVQNFFAQKCKKVMMMTFMNEMLRNDIKSKFKESVQFISAKAKQVNIVEKCKRYFGEFPHSVVHWGQYQDMPIKRLFQHRVKKVAVVYDPRDKTLKKQANNLDVLKKMNLMLHPYYTLKKVVGLDVCPQRNGPPSVIAFYDAVGGHIPFFQRGAKRRGQFQAGGPGPKRPMQGPGAGRPNQGPGGRPNQGPGGRPNQGPGPQGPRNQMNKRRGGMGGPGGPQGGRGGFFQKRPRMDDRPQPLNMPRGPGGPRGRFNQRPQPMGRQPNPWGGDVRRDNYNDRPNYNDERPAEHTVQAAKAVLSQLNTIIENQLLLAGMNQGGGGARNRPDEDWGRPAPPRDSFGSGPRAGGGGAGGSGLGGPPTYGNEPSDYFSRDRSPPSLNLSSGFRPSSDFGISRNRDFGGSRVGGLGGPSGGSRRGGGGGGGGAGGKPFRSNFTRR
uniref:Uncharacterized protein n=1 Tax=Lygus hesperus TaxID=30085 RepID=A0A0A9W5M4_LYGHE